MQDVAGRMLGDFAKRFETYLLTGETEPSAAVTANGPARQGAGATAAMPSPRGGDEEALDLGSVVFRTPAVQRGVIAVALALLLILLSRRRRR
jgi:hypothetical protein